MLESVLGSLSCERALIFLEFLSGPPAIGDEPTGEIASRT
jgi:hypothetical protein